MNAQWLKKQLNDLRYYCLVPIGFSSHFMFFIFLIIHLTPLVGQGKIHYEHIEKEDGAQLGHVFNIFEDNTGFIWFCTNEGLAKYDGYTFQYFYHDKEDSNTLTSSWIYSGLQDSKSRLWIGTGNGLNLMNPRTEVIQRFYTNGDDTTSVFGHQIRDIFEDSKGRIWVGTFTGICYYDEEKENFRRIHAPDFKGSRHTANIYEDQRGNIWVTSNKGLYKINEEINSAVQMLPINPTQAAPTYLTIDCYEDSNGILWITTSGGIWQFDPTKNTYTRLELPQDLVDKHYSQIIEYPKGYLMIGSFDVGLISWDLNKNQLNQAYSRTAFEAAGLTVNSTYCLTTDSRNNLWVGLFHGANKINLLEFDFKLYQNVNGINDLRNYILRVYGDPQGGVWVNSMRGLFYRPSLDALPLSITGDFMQTNQYYSLDGFCLDDSNKLWFGQNRIGLFNYNLQTKKINKIASFNPDEDFQHLQIICDRQKTNLVWVSCQLGLYCYDQEAKKGSWFYPEDDLNTKAGNSLGKMIADVHENLWIIQNNALLRFNTSTETFRLYALDYDEFAVSTRIIALIYENDQLSVTTTDALYRYIEIEDKFTFYSTNDGIGKAEIVSMQGDDKGGFWFGQNGITSYVPSLKTSQSYKISHKTEGLIMGSSSKTPDGYMLFPSTNGLLAFHPDSVKIDSLPPQVMLRSIKVNNERIQSIVASEFLDSLTLTWDDKIITFEYAGLKYNKVHQLEYKIMLEGFDDDWRFMGKKRDATYTNLNPGQYTFKILAANADGVWTKKPKLLHIKVLPPYWQSSWFYGLVSLIISSILYAILLNYRVKQKLSREKVIAEQSTRYKSLFLANMSHEIRTPMNTILGMNNLMLDTKLSEKQYEYAEIISQSSENLLVIINDILDHSRIESGKYTFKNKPFALDKALRLLQGIFEAQTKEKELLFTINVAPETPFHLKGDVIRLKQILINLIGNAIKFTEKGAVSLTIKPIKIVEQQAILLFEISDTGVGIPEELKDRIFESFERAIQSGGKEIAGTGLGLSIANQLVKQQGGNIWLDSVNHPKGSKFSFTLSFEITNQIFTAKKEVFKSKILEKYSFLIVEDSLFNQKLLEELLKKYFPNTHIEITDNGQKGVDLVTSNNYDLVFMDVKMPVMDGFEATKKIRVLKDLKKQQTRIIAVTANAIPSQLEQCQQAGMNGYITKPIEAEEMLAKIHKILEIKIN